MDESDANIADFSVWVFMDQLCALDAICYVGTPELFMDVPDIFGCRLDLGAFLERANRKTVHY